MGEASRGTDFAHWAAGPARLPREGRLDAAAASGLDLFAFPEIPPFTAEQVLDPDFLPRHPDHPALRGRHP